MNGLREGVGWAIFWIIFLDLIAKIVGRLR